MDRCAYLIANALVGNDKGAAALEFAMHGGTYSANRPVLIAVTGGAVDVLIDGQPCLPWESVRLRRGQTLQIGALKGSVWGYLAISGGIDVPELMGSRSTNLRTSLGGLGGRALSSGDELPLGEDRPARPTRLMTPWRRRRGPIRIIPGPQHDLFDRKAWEMLLGRDFTVSNQRDRMATVLEGPPIKAIWGHDIVSDAVVDGSIQIPASGRPIVLTADRQTTGGYPKIATVISADLPILAQMPSGQGLRLTLCSLKQAQQLLRQQQQDLTAAIEEIVNYRRSGSEIQ
jgi:allophanate hydrolase